MYTIVKVMVIAVMQTTARRTCRSLTSPIANKTRIDIARDALLAPAAVVV
jgi:hypothetical protein